MPSTSVGGVTATAGTTRAPQRRAPNRQAPGLRAQPDSVSESVRQTAAGHEAPPYDESADRPTDTDTGTDTGTVVVTFNALGLQTDL